MSLIYIYIYIYLDADESLICSKALTIEQTLILKIDVKLGNLMKITVSDGKIEAKVTECPSCDLSV